MAEEQVERVIKTQTATETRLAHAGEDVERLQGQMGGLSDKVETALLLREQVESFLSLQGPLTPLRTDAETLRTQLCEQAENVARMRTQHDDALTAHRHTTSRLENFDQDFQAATGKLEDVVRRVQSVERALEPINQASTSIPDVQHQLAVLKALADQVAQKTTMLEQEREAVDRAATQIAQLTRMDRELDAWLRRQEEQIRRFGPIEAKLTEVKTIQDKVLSRTEELQSHLAEDRGCPAVGPPGADRSAGADAEEQRRVRAGASRPARGQRADRRPAQRGQGMRGSSGRAGCRKPGYGRGADPGAERGRADRRPRRRGRRAGPRGDPRQHPAAGCRPAGQHGHRAGCSRMRRMDEIRPGVEQAVEQLATLKGTRELLADGLEQMRSPTRR